MDEKSDGFKACVCVGGGGGGDQYVFGSSKSANSLRNMFGPANSEMCCAKVKIPLTSNSREFSGNLHPMAIVHSFVNSSNIFLEKLLNVQKLFTSDFSQTEGHVCQEYIKLYTQNWGFGFHFPPARKVYLFTILLLFKPFLDI